MNGADAITVTWPAGSPDSVRWGGAINLPGFYEEAWYTQEIRFESNFVTGPDSSNPGDFETFKTFGITSNTGGSGCTQLSCPSNFWSHRISVIGPASARYNTTNVPLSEYMYYPEKNEFCGDYFLHSSFPAERETILSVETHIKINSAENISDALTETRINGVLVSTVPSLRFYCGNEDLREAAKISVITNNMFYGGSGPGWEPVQDSSLTMGKFKVEIPA
jgi:hypothetical protein